MQGEDTTSEPLTTVAGHKRSELGRSSPPPGRLPSRFEAKDSVPRRREAENLRARARPWLREARKK